MKRASLVVLAAACAALRAGAQTPATSGLEPTPTPPTMTTDGPAPTPAPKLKGVAGPSSESARTGQSLADVVRLSKEARKGQPPKKSLGTITNESLKKGGAAAAPGVTPAKGTKASSSGAPPARTAAPTPFPTYDVPRDDKGRSEEDWRRLVAHTRAVAVAAEKRVSDLETRAKQLENDFYAMSDGNRRDAVVKPAWDKAREDLARARNDLDTARKAVDALEDEARRTNAPPGWLR